MTITNELPRAISTNGLYRHKDGTIRVQFLLTAAKPGQKPESVEELPLTVQAAVELHAFLDAALAKLAESGEISRKH